MRIKIYLKTVNCYNAIKDEFMISEEKDLFLGLLLRPVNILNDYNISGNCYY